MEKLSELLEGEISNLLNGYGFIRRYPEAAPREDYFFHKSGVNTNFKLLEEGDIVSFELSEDSEKGDKAVNVTVITQRHLKPKEEV